jgi:hypothetical protein
MCLYSLLWCLCSGRFYRDASCSTPTSIFGLPANVCSGNAEFQCTAEGTVQCSHCSRYHYRFLWE